MASIGIVDRLGVAKPAHEAIVEKLKTAILYKHNRFKIEDAAECAARGEEPRYKLDEIKQFEVRHHEGMSTTYLTIETGLVGDEGSAASIFCRDYRHIAIAKNGGLTLLNPKRKRESLGFFNCVHSLTK